MRALIVNSIYGYVGGIERYIHKTGSTLKRSGWELYGLFEKREGSESDFGDIYSKEFFYEKNQSELMIAKLTALDIDVVFIHKLDDLDMLRKLNGNFYTVMIIHDHDYYCFRHHKYFPVKRINCPLPQNILYCSLCSMLIKRDRSSKLGFSLIDGKGLIEFSQEVKEADAAIVLSRYMMRNLELNKWDMDSIFRLYPIHQIEEEYQRDKQYQAEFLYVGQLIKGKGVDILIDACRKLKFKYSLKIVGTGNDYDHLDKLIRLYGLQKNIELVGWVDNVDEYYQKADLVIVPSRWQEPFGLIGIEAFSRKVPVVGFDVGGISEWLKHEKNGLLVKKRTPEALAEALELVNSNPSKLNDWGVNGYNLVKEKYSEKSFMESLEVILKQAKVKF